MPIIHQDEEDDGDMAFRQALCTQPHADGSVCSPSWDGYVYVCTYRMSLENNEPILEIRNLFQ